MQDIWNTRSPQEESRDFGDRSGQESGAIAFIDSSVDDNGTLAAGVEPGIEVIVLDPTRNGVEQITEVLLTRQNISSLHIVSHGSPGHLQLGATQLNQANLENEPNRVSLQQWAAALTDDADILVYGCNVAAGETGAAFVRRLSELMGATVAASVNQTGSAALGGDWELEFTTGDIQAGLAFERSAIEAYDSVMATILYDGVNPTLDPNQLAYAQIPFPPFAPPATGAFTNTLNTNFQGGTTGYAGYTNYNPQSALTPPLTLLNPAFPRLDRTTGFTLSFNVAIAAETSTSANRAGFSITALSNDLQGIELGFSNNRIFAQAQTPLFTRAEEVGSLLNQATTYNLTILGNDYTLSINRDPILSGQLRNYSAFDQTASNPPLPFDPYELPNFLFFGDNTDQANALFTLGAISVNAFPVANSNDGYATAEDTPLVVPLANTVLTNDIDADANDQLTAVLEQGPTSGTLVLNPDGTFTYTPVANFSGIVSFTYRANDGTANSNTAATVVLAVNPVADTPTLSVTPASGLKDTAIPLAINAALVDTDGSETLSLQIADVPTGAALSAGANLGNGVWRLSAANLAGLTITPALGDETDFTLTVTTTATETANNATASNATPLVVTVTADPIPPDPVPEPQNPGLIQIGNGVFTSQGSTQLLFALAERNTNLVNEIGVFVVDNAQGSIGTLNPGDAGYAQAALDRAQVLFSVLANNPSAADFTRQLSVTDRTFLSFYQVENSTTDAVRSGQTPLAAVSFGSPSLLGNALDLGALRLSVAATNQSVPIGTGSQGSGQGELIDLTQLVDPQLDLSFTVNSEAAYDNFVGFYAINQLDGGIDVNGDGQIDYRPGDVDYAEVAIQRTVLQASLEGTRSISGSVQLGSGVFLAPYIIADGAIAELLASNPDNQPTQVPQAYFAFLGANPDGADHVRLLGDNTFGFEDLFGGGDADFNDVVIQVKVA